MKNREKILDDLAQVAGGTASIFSGMARNIREDLKSRIDDAAMRLNLVPREDFERLEAVLTETRRQLDEQNKRIAALEKTKTATPKTKKQ